MNAGSAEIADLLGLTTRRVQTLVTDGIIPKLGRGQFDLVAVAKAYIAYLRERTDSHGASQEYRAARVRIAEARALEGEIANATRAGELIPSEAVHVFVQELAVLFASELDGLAGRMAPMIVPMDDAAEIRELIRDECNRIRAGIAERVEVGGHGAATSVGGGDHSPTAPKNARPVGRSKSKSAGRKARGAGTVQKRKDAVSDRGPKGKRGPTVSARGVRGSKPGRKVSGAL